MAESDETKQDEQELDATEMEDTDDESSDDDDTSEEVDDETSDDDSSEEEAADQDAAPAATEALPSGLYSADRAFTDLPLSPEVLQGIAEIGWKLPTRVQAMTIEPGLAGRDMLVRSKTGTGKTGAFCIPMIERIQAGERITRAIVLAPTRELALQVATECAAIAKYKDLRVAAIYGGVGFGPQEDALREGAEIVVGTPGRILDHLRRKNLDLSQATFACLDEADEMLSMGFYEDVRKILDQTPETRQVFLFSATVDERVRGLVKTYMKDPEDILLSTDADKVEGITHVLYETSPDFHKARALLAILDQEQPKSAIIFCNTREDTATVQAFLSRQGLDAELISGELPQKKREIVMRSIKRGELQFLVATDVAARGIDISDLSHVINYSLPEDPAVYLHRTGRTGRIGKKGIAISLAGGLDMHTRNTLTRQYGIEFVVKPLPTPAEADRARVERQVRSITRAIGTMAFESYLGTVRALKERQDGDMLLAAALRGFFLWDRMRKAAEDEANEPSEAPSSGVAGLDPTRGEGRERREGGRGDRRDRGDRGDRRDRDRDRGDRRDRDRDRGDRGSRPAESRSADSRPVEPRPAEGRPAEGRPVEPRPSPSQVAPEADSAGGGEGGEARKKRRRRRRRSGGGPGGEGGGEANGGDSAAQSESDE